VRKLKDRFTDESRFWVIFDTCQLSSYYQDLHNLLALPPGAIIRYDYRAKYIADSAIPTVKGNGVAPRYVLLVYAQWENYTRGAGLDYKPLQGERVFVTATRIARMRLIPNIGGDGYAFDLELEGYPKFADDTVRSIWQKLAKSKEIPWFKWVTICNLTNHFDALKSGQGADNWAVIVERLGAAPSQFASDVFWRLASPLRDGKKIIVPTFETQGATESGGIRQVSFSYPLAEGHSAEFEVFSHGAHKAKRRLRVSVVEGGSLEYNGPPDIDLRYDAATRTVVRGQRAETVDDRFGLLTLDSGEPVDDWPVGPRLTLQFKIFKSKWAGVISLILLLLAVVLGFAAKDVWKASVGWGIATVVGAAACIVIAFLLLTRKIVVKL
jgi:hypothetical protein